MEGFEVVTSDDCKIGHVVAVEDKYLIVEHGMLKKTKHAVPETFAHADESEQTVRLSIGPGNTVSRRLAVQHGFTQVDEQQDDEDGLELVYELPVGATA